MPGLCRFWTEGFGDAFPKRDTGIVHAGDGTDELLLVHSRAYSSGMVRLAEQLADLRGCFCEDIGGGSFDRFPLLRVHRSQREIRELRDQPS
jgi:hypothetical protein